MTRDRQAGARPPDASDDEGNVADCRTSARKTNSTGRGDEDAFTLIELLVVLALIAGLTAFLAGGLRDHPAAALHSAQATLANLLTAARTRALASGCRVRVLVQADAADAGRFRRTLVLQQESGYLSGDWFATTGVLSLPAGVIVLPYEARAPEGLYENPGEWTKPSGGRLHSSSLSGAPVTATVPGAAGETWDVIQFTPAGTLSTGVGDLVLATVRIRAPGSFAADESPVRAGPPDRVRGVVLSTYGVPALIAGRGGF